MIIKDQESQSEKIGYKIRKYMFKIFIIKQMI